MSNNLEILNPDININKLINTEDGTTHASGGEKYQHFFGRDAEIVSGDLLAVYPQIARADILKLAKFQGVCANRKSEEDSGKILHEQISSNLLSSVWTNSKDETKISYIASDSTPMFVKLVYEYATTVKDGNEILDEIVAKKNRHVETIKDCVCNAANWVVDNIGNDGLVSVKRRSKLENFFGHGWKDSATAYIHEDGSLVQATGRIVYPEIQTLSYDALINAARLVELDNTTQDGAINPLAETYYLQANKIQRAVLSSLWNPEYQYFVSCLEEDKNGRNGKMKPVGTIESTAGRMLDSTIFDNLSDNDKQKYIEPIIKQLFSENFLTDAGVRTRSLKYKHNLNFSDYHGSEVSWPGDTYIVAKGLRKQGFPKLAEELENRIVNATNMAGNYLEFFVARDDGSLLLNYDKKTITGSDGSIDLQFMPETNHGWTISACQAIKTARQQDNNDDSMTERNTWQNSLQDSILSTIEHAPLYQTSEELKEHYPDKQDVELRVPRAIGKTALYLFCGLIIDQKIIVQKNDK